MASTAQKGAAKSKAKPASRGKNTPAQAERIAPAVIGVVLFCLGIVMCFLVYYPTQETIPLLIKQGMLGMSGLLTYFAFPLLPVMLGVVFLKSSRGTLRKGRALAIFLGVMVVYALFHIFHVRYILERSTFRNYINFIVGSYQYGYYYGRGAGVLGALLSYPLYALLDTWGAALVLFMALCAVAAVLWRVQVRQVWGGLAEGISRYRENREEMGRLRAQERADALSQAMAEEEAREEAERALQKKNKKHWFALEDAGEEDLRMLLEPQEDDWYREAEFQVEETPEQDEAPYLEYGENGDLDVPEYLRRDARPGRDGVYPGREFVSEPEFLSEPPYEDMAPWDVPGFAQEGPEPFFEDEPAPIEEDAFSEEVPDEDVPLDVPVRSKAKGKGKKAKAMPEAHREAADGEAAPVYNFPPLDLLSNSAPARALKSVQAADQEKARTLEETLRSFGITARLIGISHGPAVTRFEMQPAPGIKVSRIVSLADDIALNLAATTVRIEAPIPGKAAIGVEIPNDVIEKVMLRDVLESNDAMRHPSRLAVALGKDNAGRHIVGDLAKMPHVLIAGATGSGKSVCINTIICSILYRATPEEVRMIMIDPKVVELSVYNGIPHLLVPVVTDPKKASGALDWAVLEMTDRYRKFSERGVRDMKSFNAHLKEDEKPLPHIVVIIDELADLMMVAPGEVEDSICRLAQLARAAGIHLIIATQRPSVNVITGVIKANIPSRIAFTVASQVDSRTILDMAGAEKLLGRGDMLYYPTGMAKPLRVQGALVEEEDVVRIVDFVKSNHGADYNEDVIERINRSDMSDMEKQEADEMYDDLLPQAVEIVVEAGSASISMLQRRLRVGYARAGRLIDEMAARGIVSQSEGAKPRNVLITREEFHQMFDDE